MFQLAFADVTRNGMKPAEAAAKAFKRIEEIFARYSDPAKLKGGQRCKAQIVGARRRTPRFTAFSDLKEAGVP